MKQLFTILSAFLLTATLSANNIAISNLRLTGKNASSHYTMVQFDISWENSWRTSSAPNNWDAAWVFVKYRVQSASGGDGEWHHAWLNNTGHTAPAGSTIDIGLQTPGTSFNAATNPGLGAFLYRSADGTGTFTKSGVQLRWNYGSNFKTGTTPIGDNDVVDVQVFVIEMVYVPEGSFAAGSGVNEIYAFILTTINTANATTAPSGTGSLGGTAGGYPSGQTAPANASWPNGYAPFYCMKYEISQQQYVDFLNTLTQTQATARNYTGNSYRYAITGTTVGSYSTANPYVACNYLSWDDGTAYTAWAGLRPMSELEFEKACRGVVMPVPYGYAWGTSTIASGEYVLSAAGTSSEGIGSGFSNTVGNAIYNGTKGSIDGPLRVGIFASNGSSTGRVTAGATYYGIMEMSGNLYERSVTIGNAEGQAFTGLHGDGSLTSAGSHNIINWPAGSTAEGSGSRAGGFTWDAEYLRVSNRRYAKEAATGRGWDYGFRSVRSIALPSLTTTAASSISFTTATSGGNIASDGGAAVTARGVCYSTTTNPTIAGNYTTDGSGTGDFTSSLTGLASGTTYYVRAYATTLRGTSYGNEVSFTTLGTCGSFTISHVSSGGVAPVNKTVTYGTVSGIPGVTTKCWITSNLGADHQATAVNDATEASAGWYWQFNRKQGYKHDGTTRTPNTVWITSISESSDWIPANDPCALELGAGWRIPTVTEWTDVDASGGWTDWNGPWNSGLKMHAAGYLHSYSGDMQGPGEYGYYPSSVQSGSGTNYNLSLSISNSYLAGNEKMLGSSVRCLRDMIPTLTTTAISNVGTTTATGGGNVISEFGSAVTERGVCWSTTATPTIADSHTSDGTGTGTFSSTITGLSQSTLYYVRAFASNGTGTAYGNQVTCTTATAPFICGTSSITISHTAGDVAPVNKTVTYGTVTNIPGETSKCWITSNLGADHQATAINDATEASAGWYWQFNRKQGYKHDGTTLTPSWPISWNISENSEWLPANDPCTLELGTGWRIPTNTEWNSVFTSGGWNVGDGPWSSGLKLHAAGNLKDWNGDLEYRSINGHYWSSIQAGNNNAGMLYVANGASQIGQAVKPWGYSLRCLRDLLPTVTTTEVSNIGHNTATGGGTVISDWGSAVTERGVCWSMTATPTTANGHTSDGTGAGTFSSTITGLWASTLYYVRAYATNGAGTAYGNEVSFTTTAFTCGSTFTINHLASGGVAPVNKSATYGTVSTTLFGGTKCAITRNLGASQQATAKDDATESSAGWYWQFNRKQGYQYTTSRTPAGWDATNDNQSATWQATKDPCTLELGSGWRIPTNTEWTAADALWSNYDDAYGSVLKLHAAGYLLFSDGSLNSRGSGDYYWSSTQYDATNGWYLFSYAVYSGMNNFYKMSGFPVRCLRDY